MVGFQMVAGIEVMISSCLAMVLWILVFLFLRIFWKAMGFMQDWMMNWLGWIWILLWMIPFFLVFQWLHLGQSIIIGL